MWKLKNYHLGFDFHALLLFLTIMLPNLLWLLIPAPKDILRQGTVTPRLDFVSSVVQSFMVGFMCVLINRAGYSYLEQKSMIGICFSVFFYLFGWISYYVGLVTPVVIVILCLAPCASCLFYTWGRKNGPAFILTALFTVLHTIRGILNYTV